MPDAPPLCQCHGEPTRWNKEHRRKSGGYWRCRVKQLRYKRSAKGREATRRYLAGEKGRAAKARYNATLWAKSSKTLYELTRVRITT